MRGTGQSAFTHAKLYIKARKTLGEAPKTGAEGKSLNPGKEFLLNLHLILLYYGHCPLRNRIGITFEQLAICHTE